MLPFSYVKGGTQAKIEQARKAMGIDWMTRDELVQAIPPVYTEFIGRILMEIVR